MASGRGSVGCCSCLSCLLVTVATIYILISLAFSLLARLYLKTYYTAAHIAAMSIFVGLFLLTHMGSVVQRTLGLSGKCFKVWQIVLNSLYFGFALAFAVCYTVLAVLSTTFSYDYFATCVWSWVDIVVLFYLLVSSARKKIDYTFEPNYTGSMFTNELGYLDESTLDAEKSKSRGPGCCRKLCVCCGRSIFWVLYILCHVLLLLFFALSSYNSAASVRDVLKYRDDSEMYTVKVPFHNELALNMRCQGNGTETIVFENGKGGSMMLFWGFIPTYVSEKYRVCAYDRRGFGWSESYENERPGALLLRPQSARENVEFFRALVDAVGITKPFYYAGYSWGGHHITYMAMMYPEYVKGLIYLDASLMSSVEDSINLFEAMANAMPTGVVRLAYDTGLYDIEKVISEFLDIGEVSTELKAEFFASSFTNLYPSGLVREFSRSDVSEEDLEELLPSVEIYKPVLVIDADRGEWFPRTSFPQYSDSNYYNIDGASHSEFAHTTRYGRLVADHIITFVKQVSNS